MSQDRCFAGIDQIEESGPLVRLDRHALPDLDDLLLDVLAHQRAERLGYDPYDEPWWDGDRYTITDPERGRTYNVGGDRATSIPGCEMPGEASVGFYRKNPCACGEDHSFDMAEVPMDDDGSPAGRAARGAFLGVHFA